MTGNKRGLAKNGAPRDALSSLEAAATTFEDEIAARSAAWPTFLLMSAMAFDLSATDLDGGLTNLEELCVGYAREG